MSIALSKNRLKYLFYNEITSDLQGGSVRNIIACNLKLDLPNCSEPKEFHMPYGLATITELMQKWKIECDCFDTYIRGNTNSFLKYYSMHNHDVLLFSGIIGNYAYEYYEHIFSQIKKINQDCTIILGGPITSIYPEILLRSVPVDIIVIGEGEETFGELVENDFAIDERLFSIDGIGFRYNSDFVVTNPRKALKSPLENFSCTPLYSNPGFESLLKNYIETQTKKRRGWDITATRGCIGDCSFCRRIFDKPIRSFSTEYIVDKMEYIKERFGIQRFNFLDENFATKRKNIESFLELIEERNLDVEWRIRCRIDNIPVNMLDRMRQLGLYGVMLGLESGSQLVLDHFNKNVVLNNYKDDIRELAKYGLLYASFIIGSEVESEETIKENINLIKELKLKRNEMVICFLSVIPGTKMFEKLYQKGIVKDKLMYIKNYIGDFENLEMNISNMSNERILSAKEEMLRAGEL
jgi:radical SAM superfamily enzyme YgiQ (UPF0313 family)